MSVEQVRVSLAAALASETAMDRLTVPHRAMLKACCLIEDQQEELWETWNQQVIDAGNALIESQRQYGAEWHQDYDSLGYGVSYADACNYIACAQRQEAGEGTTSLGEWVDAIANY